MLAGFDGQAVHTLDPPLSLEYPNLVTATCEEAPSSSWSEVELLPSFVVLQIVVLWCRLSPVAQIGSPD